MLFAGETNEKTNAITFLCSINVRAKVLKWRRRIESYRTYNDISDLQLLEESLSSGSYEIPELPGPSITIDSTGESPEQTTQNIIAMLPESMKKTISF